MIKFIYSFNRNAWSTHPLPDPAVGEAEVSKGDTVSILMDFKGFAKILCPKLRKKETSVLCKNLCLITYMGHT